MNALVTGAGMGIGYNLALKLATLNYNLFLTYYTHETEIKKLKKIIENKYKVKCIITKLDLKDIEVINLRAEEYMKYHLNEYDVCISRAVAYIDIITSLSLPFIKADGRVILMKGNYQDELKILNTYKNELHISNFNIINYKILYDYNNRSLIVISKNEVTSKIVNYPKLLKQSEMRRKKLNLK